MTSPDVGGSANIGTVTGRVRIDYESSNAGRAAKEVQNFQSTLQDVGKSATQSAKEVDRAGGTLSQFGRMMDRLGQKPVPNPAQGLGTRVENETQRATKALASLQRSAQRPITMAAAIKVNPTRVDLDMAAFNRGLSGNVHRTLAIVAPLRFSPTRVILDQRALDTAMQNVATQRLVVRAPIHLDPSQVTVNQGAINNAVQAVNAAGSSASGGDGGGGMSGIVPMLGRITFAAGGAAAALGAVGYTLSKGFSRLTSIDEATVKLNAMGYSMEQIKSISKDAESSVLGTAYGLNEAFATATDAINAGIKPGQQLNQYLSATANTAALAGVGMQDLGTAFSQAAIQGKLTGDIMSLLVSRQVPVLKLLADEYKVTEREAQNMVSNGEISFDRFMNAMSQTAGAAKGMGNTIGGSFSNLKAAITRLGANLLAPLFGKSAAGDANTIAMAIQKVTGWIDTLGKTVKSNAGGIVSFWEGAAKVALTTAKVFTTVANIIAEAIIRITQTAGDMAGWLTTTFATVADAVGADGIAADAREAAAGLHDLGEGIRDTKDNQLGRINRTIDGLWRNTEEWAEKARDAAKATDTQGSSAEAAAPKILSLKDALGALEIKADSAEKALMGTNEQFEEFLEAVREKGGTEDLIRQLEAVRSAFVNGGRQVKDYADAIDNLGDSTIDASDRAKRLIDALKGLNQLPGGDQLSSYNAAFDDMTSYTSNLIDLIDTTGDSLVNLDGTLNQSSKNGRTLLGEVSKIRQEMYALAASGEATPEEAWERTASGLRDLFIRQAGISPAMAEQLINSYLLPKDKFAEQMANKSDPKGALESLFADDPAKLDSMLNLLTTTEDILGKIVGPDGKLHVPTVLDTQAPGLAPPGTPPPPPPGTPPPPGSDPGAAPDGIGPKVITDEDLKGKGTWYKLPNGKRAWVAHGQPVPPGAVPDSNQTKEGSAAPSLPPHSTAPVPGAGQRTDNPLGGPLGLPGTPAIRVPVSPERRSDIINQLGDIENVERLLKEQPELAKTLDPFIEEAKQRGERFSAAFARGIDEGSPEVQQAIIRLAQLAGEGLGNSPAKYGPLSGKGWTLSRGKVFTQDWAKGIASEAATVKGAVADTAGQAVSGMSGFAAGGSMPLNDQIAGLVGDLQQFSDFGKSILDLTTQVADLFLGIAKFANDMSGGTLFPKSYKQDPNFDSRRGSALGGWNPTRNPNMMPGINGQPGNNAGFSAAGSPAIPTNAKGDAVASEFIKQARAAGFNQEQILAGLGVLSQETGFGTNPATNNIQNQNGTAGITGVFQQDMSYRKYGDPRDPNNAIRGYISEFVNRGGMTEDPWNFAVSGVQKPANVGAGGYWDKSGAGAGAYLKNKQRNTALEVYNRLGGGQHTLPAPSTRQQSTAQGNVPVQGGRLKDTGSVPSNDLVRNAYNIVEQMWGSQLRGSFSGSRPAGTSAKGTHDAGTSLDIPIGPEQLGLGDQISKFFLDNAEALGVKYTIFRNQGRYPATPDKASFSSPGHFNHIDVHFDRSRVGSPGQLAPGALTNAASAANQAVPTTLVGPSATGLSNLVENTSGLPSMPSQLQGLIGQDPVIANAMRNQSALTADTVVPVLQALDGHIARQEQMGTAQSKQLATALGDYKSTLQNQFGMVEGPSALDTATTVIGGVGNIAGGIMGLVDQGLKTISAAQDIGNTLVRGIENTGDVNRIIDNAQEFITLFQKGFQLASDISGFAAQIANIGSADPTGGGGAAAGALSAVSAITGLIAQGLAAVNTAIDVGQEAYAIVTKYVGRFIQAWTGLSGATDVKYLLDEMTGQVAAYSSDNPQDKRWFNTIGRNFGAAQDGRPNANNTFHIYQGPGQDPRDTMNDAMFAVRSSGVGAFGYAV